MANELEIRESCRAMMNDLRNRIHDKNVIINENKAKVEKEKFVGKLIINKEINDDTKSVKLMTELMGKLFVVNNNLGKNRVIVQPEFKSAVEDLCSLLSDKEVENFIKVFDNYIKCSTEDEIKDLHYNMYCIDILIKQLKFSDTPLTFLDDDKKETVYSKAFETIKSINLENDKITIDYKSKSREKELPVSEEKMIVKLVALNKNGSLVLDKSTSLIMDNIYSIRNAFVTRARINNIMQKITNLLSILDKIENWNVLNVKSYLSKLTVKYGHELDKANKYLDKFDFTSVKNQVEKTEEEKKMTAQERFKMVFYEELAFELEKVTQEEPDNLEYNVELNKKMSAFAVSSGLTSAQLEKAHDNGVRRYNQENAFMNEFKRGGKSLYNEYLTYCQKSKEKDKLSFLEYVRAYHGLEELDSITEYSSPGKKM